MRSKNLFLVAVMAILTLSAAASAQSLIYSFEADTDGFGPNGGGITVTQDTIGATEGSHSLKSAIVGGATFVGALTGNVPAAVGDPPGLESVLFDMTIEQPYAGAFADIGITIFGASQPDYPGGQQFGLQAQFADFQSVGGLAAGTYSDVRIDLSSATHPLTFDTGQSFNQIFGVVGSGVNDVIPSGFQFFFSKSNDAPLTVYIDNVRAVVPEPGALTLMGLATLAFAGWRRRGR